ncbi:MAG: enoyl-CoA hydratase/isomerase family protein [Acidimicrobiales bacterium]
MPILYEKADGVATITLSRPEARNAWGADYTEGLRDLLPEIEEDDEVGCVVLTGDPAGGAFSAGANLKDPATHAVTDVGDHLRGLARYRRQLPFETLTDFAKPVVAAVDGYAVGIGCLVTFCCDLIVASDRAEWRLPQTALGILPAYGGAPRVARWVGKGLTARLAYGFPLGAEEAHRIGVAQWLATGGDDFDRTVAEVAGHLAALPPLAARLTKESLTSGMNIPNLGDAALADVYRFMALSLTEDRAEGHDAWRERRAPRFTGR